MTNQSTIDKLIEMRLTAVPTSVIPVYAGGRRLLF